MYRNDDPPEDKYAEMCPICGNFAENCVCPECEVCGEHGNPLCINRHMPYSKWFPFIWIRDTYIDTDDFSFGVYDGEYEDREESGGLLG
jgi:hypothetical protein